uniref:Transmembrane protein 144 n=1 Tax=Ditylenchus dipsaci TaxID=166011 RepID=A0A915CYA3_9BILA
MSPPIRIYAVFGGMLWTIANSLSQYVISGLGLAVGLVLWNTTNCLTGWLSGRFGLFGLKAVVPTHDQLNIAGLVILLIGGLLFAFVRRTRRLPDTPTEHSDVENPFSASDKRLSFVRKSKSMPLLHVPDPSTVEKVAQSLKKGVTSNSHRIICIVLALLSGFFYGATTIPVIYMEDHPEEYPSSSRSGIPYIFSHYFGIFIGSSIIFVGYALFRKNKPIVNPAVILPSMLGGMIWVTYPVMTTLPGCIASLWSVFYFKEINSKRNYVIICFAFVIIASGAVLFSCQK